MDRFTDKRTENAWLLFLKETKQKSDRVNKKVKRQRKAWTCVCFYGQKEKVQVWGGRICE